MNTPTRSFPFGRDVDTLILCRDEDHRRAVIAALGIPAQYETVFSVLTGLRFKKIIVFDDGRIYTPGQLGQLQQMAREYWPTMLYPGGKIHFL